jgi:hypothetical protein
VDGVVLGVDGKQGYVVLLCCCDDELAGGYEALFVGEANGFAGTDRGVCGFEAGYAYDGRDDEVYLGKSRCVDAAGGAVDYFDIEDVLSFETGFQIGCEFFCRERNDLWTPTEALGKGYVDVAACCEGDDLVAFGEGIADRECAVADGSGRA